MAELTFQDVFGANATQTATTITFNKADLAAACAAAGFAYTPGAVDGAEKTFAAILFGASNKLNATNRELDLANRNIEIEKPAYPSIVSTTSGNYQRDIWTANLYKPFNYVPLTADSY